MTRKRLSVLISKARWMLRGTVVRRYLKCRRSDCMICKSQGGHGPVYYLSMRGKDGRTRMIYVPKERLSEVRKAVGAYKEIKDGLKQLAAGDLEKWQADKRRKEQ